MPFFHMDALRVSSLNINGGGDRGKLALISEFLSIKKIYIFFFYKKHILIRTMTLNWVCGGRANFL